jgi:uncharacterized membrane protein YgcG
MKKFLAATLTVLFTLAFVSSAYAAAGESIDDFSVRIVVTEAGQLHITETIVYNFGENERHGIRRDIPQLDHVSENKVQPYSLVIKKVSQDGNSAKFTQGTAGDYLELKVGNPDVTISGIHTYTFDYVVSNGLKRITKKTSTLNAGDVSLYWDVIGNQWEVPISHASAVIEFPGIPKQLHCTYGPQGSTTTCPIESDRTTVSVAAPTSLNAFEAMTVSVQVDSDSFSGLTAPIITDAPVAPSLHIKPTDLYSAGLGAFIAFICAIFAFKRRRRVTKFPIQDFVRFEPPAGLKPAELQAAWHGKVDAKGFTATLLDLSARGILSLSLQDKHIVVTSRDLQKPMADWEKLIVTVVLGDSTSVVLDEYRVDVDVVVEHTSETLLAAAFANKYRNPQASRSRHIFIVLARIFGLGLVISFTWGSSQFFSLIAGFAVFGLIGSLISIFMIPVQQTKESADFLGAVEGFRKFLDTDAAEDRREFAQRSGLDPAGIFATMLPYAVVYELDKSWCAAFPDLTPAQLNTYGLAFVDTSHMSRSLRDASQSMATAMTSPMSSGSGAGGGFSGGGGGGGGGGSW